MEKQISRPRSLPVGVIVLVIAAAVCLASSSTSSVTYADTQGSVTSELRQGWNLVGWLGAEESVDSFFQALDHLERIYAWDASAQRYRMAARIGQQTIGDLKVLTPGMGLWIKLGGSKRIVWTQEFVPRSGLAELDEGWNLVVWAGREGVSYEEAFSEIRSILVAAETWDRNSGWHERCGAQPPCDSTELQTLSTGATMWLNVTAKKQWWQRDEQPTLEFVSELARAKEASLTASVEDVVAFFARRYGVGVSGLTIRFGDNTALSGAYGDQQIYIADGYLSSQSTLAHEYVHALQFGLSDGIGGVSTTWLSEGGAVLGAGQYLDYCCSAGTYSIQLERAKAHARKPRLPLEQMELDFRTFYYTVAWVAADYLSQRFGHDSFLRYYRLSRDAVNQDAAFLDVFGVTLGQFYVDFEAYVPANQVETSGERVVSGTVVQPDGSPANGIRLMLFDLEGWKYPYRTTEHALTGRDGTFSIRILQGSGKYNIIFRDGACHIGWYSTEGGGTVSKEVEPNGALVMEDSGPTVVTAKLPRSTEGICVRVRGVVVSETGQPLGDIAVNVYPAGGGTGATVVTDGTGIFSVRVSTLVEEYTVLLSSGPACLLPFGEHPGSHGGLDRPISIRDGQVQGLKLYVSQGALVSC